MTIVEAQGMLIALLVSAAAVPQAGAAQTATDTVHLREFIGTYRAAFDAHDPAAVAALFAEDADLMLDNSPTVEGREAIERWWRSYFERPEAQRRAKFDVTSLRLLAKDVALMNVTTETGGVVGGGALPLSVERATWVMRRRNTQWLIEAARTLPAEGDSVELNSSLEAAEALRPDIRAFVGAYEETFDSHDAEALSTFYRADADIIVRDSPTVHGAQAIQEWWRAYFAEPRPYRVLLILKDIKMMSEDVALLNFTVTGAMVDAANQLRPVRWARATWVILRQNGKWRIAALRVLPSEDDRVVPKVRH